MAKRILNAVDLIGGPMSAGRVGDYYLGNDRIRVVIQDVGRDPLGFVSPYGGNIIDADLVRGPGEPDNDQFMAMSPQINIESTMHATLIEIINDGSNGGDAVVRVSGVDDSLDSINASELIKAVGGGLPLSLPESADDKDIPVELVTEYSLGLGDSYVKIETFIKNVGTEGLGVYIGDYLVNAAGEADLFVPGIGFGDPMVRLRLPFICMRGEGSAQGMTYGYIPGITKRSTCFTQTGVTATTLGVNVVGILLLGLPPFMDIEPDGVFSFKRYFAVGTDIASVVQARNEIFGRDTGILKGTVTVAGTPLENATVAVVKGPGEFGSPYNVVSAFQTDANGAFEGTLTPGNYDLLVSKDGYLYDSEKATPEPTPVNVYAGGTTEAFLTLPLTGRLRVRSMDASGSPIPSKVSIVGFDPSPPLANVQDIFGLLELGGYVSNDPGGENLFGIAGALFLGPDGDSGEVMMEPGDYEMFVSHGPEYSLYQGSLQVSTGQLTSVDTQIARVVDTSGFVSGDFHVHMMNSPDSSVPLEDRVRAFLAEGVDYLVASDHEYLTDLKPTIQDMGAEDLIATSIGQEITPQDYGHYHAWPLTLDPTRRSMGALDWGQEAPVGEDYRTLGNYCMSPGEIFDAVRADPSEEVVQINHMNSGGGGGMNILGIDTGLIPPQSTKDPGPFRLDPTIANLFDPDFDALEVLIGEDRGQVETFFNENLGDWFNLLNQGLIYSATSDSDTHSRNFTQAGTFRNFIASSTDSPGAVQEAELTANIKGGRMTGGYSPFLRATLQATSTGETGALDGVLPRTISTTDGSATFRLEMQSPVWVEFDAVELYMNNVPLAVDDDGDPATPPQYKASPDVTLQAGVDFTIQEVVDNPGIPGASHYEAAVDYVLAGLAQDTWIVALVRGTDGVSSPLFPVVPNDLGPEANASLADLLDGNLGEDGMMALAFTNPLFLDVDGNGVYDPPATP